MAAKPGLTLSFQGENVTWCIVLPAGDKVPPAWVGGKLASRFAFRLDASKSPKEMTLTPLDPEKDLPPLSMVYSLERDTLALAPSTKWRLKGIPKEPKPGDEVVRFRRSEP